MYVLNIVVVVGFDGDMVGCFGGGGWWWWVGEGVGVGVGVWGGVM